MNERWWKRFLSRVRDGDGMVVPVVGPQLLVAPDGIGSLQAQIARKLLDDHRVDPDQTALTPLREIHDAVALLRQQSRANAQSLYQDVDDALSEGFADLPDDAIPAPLRQLADIDDFRLIVTLTPDDLLARCLRRRRTVREIVHSPRLPTSESADLDVGWAAREGEVNLLYLFGKARPAPMFAIHDEDVLEYAHNIVARGGQVPLRFLGALQERSLLLLGCDFPDWLGRFLLRATNLSRLSEKGKPGWLVEGRGPQASTLTTFLERYSRETEVLSDLPVVAFVAEMQARWDASRPAPSDVTGGTKPPQLPARAMFFISYSRVTDRANAERLFQELQQLGLRDNEIWLDRSEIDPGDKFRERIFDGIETCRYFLPLLSEAGCAREEGFVFREWEHAFDRRKAIPSRTFVLPVSVDADYAPQRLVGPECGGRIWRDTDVGHAPAGAPDETLRDKLVALIRKGRSL